LHEQELNSKYKQVIKILEITQMQHSYSNCFFGMTNERDIIAIPFYLVSTSSCK